MRQLKIILIPIILAYLTIAGLYVGFQRKLIYYPTKLNGTTPAKYGLSHFKEITFPSGEALGSVKEGADKTRSLTGWWIEHPNKDPERPVLLYCHGNAANLSLLSQVAKEFYDFGFDALLFDYGGYGTSEKGPLSEDALENDALGAYRWLQARGVPADRIIIWGQSLGSSVAAKLALQVHPAGLILEGAFPSIHAVARKKYPWLLVPGFLIWDKFETGKYVTLRDCPLLEMHMGRDTIIPIDLGKRVFEAAKEPKQWLEVPGIDHNDFPSVAYGYKERIMGFVKECLEKRK